MIERLIIRELRTDDSISQITALLHDAYASLAAQGMRYLASYQDDATTEQRLKSGFPFVAELEGAVVATVTLYPTELESPSDWYKRSGVYHFGQFAVRPDLQGEGIGKRLVQFVEEQARRRGATELALDTAEGAIHLRQWYERLGFRFIEYIQWPRPDYRSVILLKQINGNF